MDSTQDLSNDKDIGEQVMEGLGEQPNESQGDEGSHGSMGSENANDPLYVQKRLKQQKRAHEREIRELHARISDMQAGMQNQMPPTDNQGNPYMAAPQQGGMDPVDESIRKAVSFALQQKEMEERRARELQGAAHVAKQNQEMHKHLDSMNDKYDDFDDVVKGPDTPYTKEMATAAMALPRSGPGSAGEVLYKLGKNPDELRRIASLHPLDQLSEMVKLSHALISAGEQKGNQNARPLGQIKSNPVTNSHVITDKTPVGSIRQRMKSGNWK